MKNLRKRIWIDSFQTGLLVRITLYCVVYQVVAGAFYVLCDQINAGYTAMGAKTTLLSNSLVRSLLTLVILVPPLTLDAVRFAHRLVGPLYRFRKTVQSLAAGEPVARVRLRKGDMLLDFQDDFNRMLEYLEQRGYVLLKAPEAAAPASAEASANMAATAVQPGS